MKIEAGTPIGNKVKKVFVDGKEFKDVVFVDTDEGICRFIPRDEHGQLKFDLLDDDFCIEEIRGTITLEMDEPKNVEAE